MGGRGISRDGASHPGDVRKTFIKFIQTTFFTSQKSIDITCLLFNSIMCQFINEPYITMICHISWLIIPHSISDTHNDRSFCSSFLNALYGCLGRQWCDTPLTSKSTSQAEWCGPLPRQHFHGDGQGVKMTEWGLTLVLWLRAGPDGRLWGGRGGSPAFMHHKQGK